MQATTSKGVIDDDVQVTGEAAAEEEMFPPLDVPYYLPVSLIKFTLLCLCTSNFYLFYWFYWNWDIISRRKKKGLWPLARAFFAVVTVPELATEIKEDAKEAGVHIDSSFDSAVGLFLILTFGPRLFKTAFILSSFNFLALLPLVASMQEINHERAPKCPPNDTFGIWNIFILLVGGAIFGLALVGFFFEFLGCLN